MTACIKIKEYIEEHVEGVQPCEESWSVYLMDNGQIHWDCCVDTSNMDNEYFFDRSTEMEFHSIRALLVHIRAVLNL